MVHTKKLLHMQEHCRQRLPVCLGIFAGLKAHKTPWCTVKCNSFIDRNLCFLKLTIKKIVIIG
jgi:hypothetical protein